MRSNEDKAPHRSKGFCEPPVQRGFSYGRDVLSQWSLRALKRQRQSFKGDTQSGSRDRLMGASKFLTERLGDKQPRPVSMRFDKGLKNSPLLLRRDPDAKAMSRPPFYPLLASGKNAYKGFRRASLANRRYSTSEIARVPVAITGPFDACAAGTENAGISPRELRVIAVSDRGQTPPGDFGYSFRDGRALGSPQSIQRLRPRPVPPFYAMSSLRAGNLGPCLFHLGPSQRVGEARRNHSVTDEGKEV